MGFALKKTIRHLSELLLEMPEDVALMQKLEAAVGLARDLPFEVNIWRAQNNYYQLVQTSLPDFAAKADQGDAAAQEWIDHFIGLGGKLGIKVERPAVAELRLAS